MYEWFSSTSKCLYILVPATTQQSSSGCASGHEVPQQLQNIRERGGIMVDDSCKAARRELLDRYAQGEGNYRFHPTDFASFLSFVCSAEGADIERSHGSGFTPLHAAALHGAPPGIVELLLRKGANVAATCFNGFTALHISSLFGRLDLIDVLVRIGGSPLEKEDDQGRTPLLVAVFFGESRAAGELVMLGSDVNHRYRDGVTPLHCAVRLKHRHLLMVLLFGRSNTTLLSDGQTAAQLALSLGYDDIADEIVGYGRQKSLQSAVLDGEADAIPMILNSEPRVIDRHGQALCIAITARSEPCVKALLDHHDSRSYVNNANIERVGWLSHVLGGALPSPRIARLLVEAGANTVSPILCKWDGRRIFEEDPVQALRTAISADSEEEGVDDEHIFRLERILRLFIQAPAVHATSWLWPNGTGGIADTTWGKSKQVKKPSAIIRMIPLLRRRGARRRELLLAVERFDRKGDAAFHGTEN